MKKRFWILLVLFCYFCFGSFNTFADESFIQTTYAKNVRDLTKINMLRAILDDDSNTDEALGHLNYYYGDYIVSGTITAYLDGTFNGTSCQIKECLSFEDNMVSHLQYSFQGEVFYDADLYIDECDNEHIDRTIDEDFDICAYYNNYDSYFKKGTLTDELDLVYTDIGTEELVRTYSSCYFGFLWGMYAKSNTTYTNKDVHITFGVSDKKTMDEIKENISITDESDPSLSYDIIFNTYDYDTATIGVYSFYIVAWDTSKNVTIQQVYVDVYDDIAPAIPNITEPIETEYSTLLTEEALFELIKPTDDSDIEYTFDLGGYLDTPDVIGDYNCTIVVTDEIGNSSSKDFILRVVDTHKPKIMFPQTIKTNSNTPLTEDDIMSLLSATDEYDGDLKDNIQLTDVEDYFSNSTVSGAYLFKAYVEDSSGNSFECSFNVVVEDTDFPSIIIDKYIILTERGEPITKEQIWALFESLGTGTQLTSLESECFYIDYLDGEYELEVIKEDGSIEYDVITTNEVNSDISYEVPIKEEKKSVNLSMILILSISSSLVLVCLGMGIVVYKKKH